MPTIAEYILGGVSIVSFVIAVWQIFESRYYRRLDTYQNQQITDLINENQNLLQKIDRTSQQTIKHKDMNILLPKLLGANKENIIEQKIMDGINEGFNELKRTLTSFVIDKQPQALVKKDINKFDSKIEETRKKTISNTSDNLRMEEYVSEKHIDNLDELHLSIQFLQWLNDEPREFIKRENEAGNLLREKHKFITYGFPQVKEILGNKRGLIPMFFDFEQDLIIIKDNKITLSQVGIRLLNQLKNLYNLLQQQGK